MTWVHPTKWRAVLAGPLARHAGVEGQRSTHTHTHIHTHKSAGLSLSRPYLHASYTHACRVCVCVCVCVCVYTDAATAKAVMRGVSELKIQSARSQRSFGMTDMDCMLELVMMGWAAYIQTAGPAHLKSVYEQHDSSMSGVFEFEEFKAVLGKRDGCSLQRAPLPFTEPPVHTTETGACFAVSGLGFRGGPCRPQRWGYLAMLCPPLGSGRSASMLHSLFCWTSCTHLMPQGGQQAYVCVCVCVCVCVVPCTQAVPTLRSPLTI